jgi:hypothetical protein
VAKLLRIWHPLVYSTLIPWSSFARLLGSDVKHASARKFIIQRNYSSKQQIIKRRFPLIRKDLTDRKDLVVEGSLIICCFFYSRNCCTS